MAESVASEVQRRAALSAGTSAGPIYDMVARCLREAGAGGRVLVDVGCGTGTLRLHLGTLCEAYWGVDAVRYVAFPADARFVEADLDRPPIPLPEACAAVVTAVEVIEHLANPRAFVRELVRLAAPGGWVVLTTPNQLSLLSLGTLIVKQRFSAFQESSYPAHLTALLEVDLRRIAAECGLIDVRIAYTGSGRMPLTARHWPRPLSRLSPRTFSDNVLLMGRKRAP